MLVVLLSALVIKKNQSKAKGQSSYLMIVFTDVDECFQGPHSCSVYAVCSNTKGSYDCRCKTGYTGDGQNCAWLGKNPLIASQVGLKSFNDIDDDIKSYRESKFEDADSDSSVVDNKTMKRITNIDRNDLADDDDSRTTTLMVVIVRAISWVM